MSKPRKGESYAQHMDRAYAEHLAREGNQPWNNHPDGCFYCGSSLHHSDCCPNRTAEDEWYQP
jgi:hypothetical protein